MIFRPIEGVKCLWLLTALVTTTPPGVPGSEFEPGFPKNLSRVEVGVLETLSTTIAVCLLVELRGDVHGRECVEGCKCSLFH